MYPLSTALDEVGSAQNENPEPTGKKVSGHSLVPVISSDIRL
jgi:hypothetical protein